MPCALQPHCCSFSTANYPALQCWQRSDFLSEYKSRGKEVPFLALFSTLIPQVSTSRYPPLSLAADRLPPSLASPWPLESPAFAPGSEVRLLRADPWRLLGRASSVLANLSRSRSSSCSSTPTCKHPGRQKTTIHNKTKPLGVSFVPLMKVIKLHAKRQRLEGMEREHDFFKT